MEVMPYGLEFRYAAQHSQKAFNRVIKVIIKMSVERCDDGLFHLT